MAKLNFFRFLAVLGGLSFSTNCVFGQYYDDEEVTRRFFGGIIVGGNASQVTGDYLQGYRHFGINAGAVTYIKFNKTVALSLELLYSVKGSKPGNQEVPFRAANNTIIRKYYIDLPYAEVPLMFHLFDKYNSSLGVGLSYARLFNAKEQVDSVNNAILHPYKKNDVNIAFNASLALYKKKLFWQFRFTHSLSTIRMTPDLNLFHRAEQSNKVLSSSVLWLF